MAGCASAAVAPVTARVSAASSGIRIGSPRIDWCTAAVPGVSVIDGARSNTCPTAKSSKNGADDIWPDKVTASHAGSVAIDVSIWPYKWISTTKNSC
jgi:hypothetical protein